MNECINVCLNECMFWGINTNLSLGPVFLPRIFLEILAASETHFSGFLWYHELKLY